MNLAMVILSFVMMFTGVPERHSARQVSLGSQFVLKVGQEAFVRRAGLTVTFASVDEDSRCPAGVTCIQKGKAEITLKLRDKNGEATSMRLDTDMGPEGKTYGQYRISLKAVNPYPREGSPIGKERYRAMIVVRRNSN